MRGLLIGLSCAVIATGAMAGGKSYKEKDCNRLTVQMDLNECAGANYDAADKALNTLYKYVMSMQTDPKARAQLHDSERAWIVSRDKSCNDEVGPQEEGGSIWSMEMSNCLQKKTDERIGVLQRIARQPSP
ncbi:MAG TPA: lysozyme inhibitor LprI family protein [Rhizomicrobium sp.]